MSPRPPTASSQTSTQSTMNPDPSVIVGMACRVPGATTPSKLWENIAERRDLQSKMPSDRFNVDAFFHPDGAHKGTMNARYGYFLEQDLGMFDAGFFGISGKEAEAMDPQQRLLLEVVYEALENAGITLDEINGTLTSVFCGSFTNDYMATTVKDLEYYPKYSVTGTGNSILSNRISYFYNLHGASVTCDTACSSSLIAFHWGSGTLQNREADISIVVGSALHYDMNIFQMMTDLSMLSTDGRSRAFDNGASGYVRGEGICAVVLKRQSDAVANSDPIRAIVRGTMANHDGRKAGITLPNPKAQEQLIRHTYRVAGLDPADTQYFEAHGTGTKAGDPRETSAIGAVFAPGREEPLYVGSVKTNVGHLEGASGLAGIIKTVMALEKGKIPPNMLFKDPNPEIKFDEWKIRVPTSMVDWPEKNGIRRASINSFGYGGTNAHVILEAYNAPQTTTPRLALPGPLASMVASRPFLIPLTSHTEKAGKLHVAALTKYLAEREDINVADLAFSLSSRRTMHPIRSFAIGHDRASVTSDLSNPQPLAKWTPAQSGRTRIGMVFTGQGAQHFAMGRELIQKSPLFRQSLERCDTVLQSLPDAPKWSVIEEMTKSKEDSRIGQTEFSQPLCTALQLAIVDLLSSWGIKPSATVGHSSGEMAAAYAAGILTFESAIIAAYYRGLYMSNTSDNTIKVPGAMMAVGLTEAQAKAELQGFKGRLAIAAINSPSSITISGDEDAILELKNTLVERKVFARQLQVAQAFHSHHMFPLAPAYERALNSCPQFVPQPPTCRMFSSVTARLADHSQMGAAYWAANMTGTVRFYEALTGILLDDSDEQNVDILLEIGAHPALKGPSRQGVTSLKLELPYLGSLTRGVPDYTSLLQCAGQLFSLGYPVDLVAINKNQHLVDGAVAQVDTGKKLIDLPTYSWDHKRYWCETRFTEGHRLRPYRHTILGIPITGSVDNRPRWRNYLRPSEIPWLNEHVVDGKIIFPGAGYISMAIEGALRLKGGVDNVKAIHMKDIIVKSALIVSTADMGTEVLLEMKPVSTSAKTQSAEWYDFGVYSYDETERCSEHCHGLIAIEKGAAAPITPVKSYASLESLRLKSNRSQMRSSFYAHLNDLGLQYGENFRLVSGNVESGPGYAYGPITYDPTAVLSEEEFDKTVLHPSLLDATFHIIFSAIESRLGRALDEAYVPSFIRSLDISGSFVDSVNDRSKQAFDIVSFTELPTQRVAVSDLLLTQGDHIALEMQGLEVTALGTGVNDGQEARSLFFRQRWQPCFDTLPSALTAPSLRSLASVVDVFAHQHPNTRILVFATNAQRVTEALKYLGTGANERRRFKCLDIARSYTNGAVSKFEEIRNASNGLVDVREPSVEELYDLVIVSDVVDVDPLPHMKENAVVIYDGANLPVNADLEPILCKDGILSAYRRPRSSIAPGDLTVIVSSLLSKRVGSIISAIKDSAPAAVSTTSFAELSKSSQGTTSDVIVLASLDEGIDDPDTFAGVKKLLGDVNKNVVWVTEGAVMESSNPAHAMVIGLARTARSENDQLRLVTLDLPEDHPPSRIASRVFEVLDAGLDEDELCERNGCLYVPRIEADDGLNSKLRHGFGKEPRLRELGSAPLALQFEKAGLLETLHFAEDEQIVDNELGEDELEIEVRAAPINFRDIAAATGSIEDSKLGDECAGVILRVGSAVSGEDFQVGDRVIALRPGQGAHKTIVRNPATLCHKITGPTTFAIVSTMPLILCTAYYSLIEVGRLGPGDTVLIHSAAGGVGQMAIQLARRQGARVLATCSTKAKRDLLRNKLGVPDDQIFSSTDNSFVAGVLKATNGQGVDVVLNSVSGPLLQATWECMNAFGRFVEIGNKDISQNSKISMDPFRRNVTFSAVDLKTMYERNRPLLSRIFGECCKLVNNGEIVPPENIYEFSFAEAEKAFRMHLSRAYPGKAVLIPSKEDMVMAAPTKFRPRQLFSADKTYLLVGGLGGLGRTLAEWMVRKGAAKLAFLSRSGANRPEAKQTVDWLRSRNISVSVHKGDVSSLADIEECIKSIGPSLAGIFQAAMVLQDAPLESMTYDQWTICTKPKCLGTYYLHRATLKSNLDFFVCFSSVANPLGSKAQANYAAANHYLDSLMRLRREMGLAGTSMNVGAITGIGVIAHDVALQKVMERLGMDLVNEEELLYQIETAVTSDCSIKCDARGTDQHTLITGINLKRNDVYWATKPLLRNLYANHDFVARDTGNGGKNLTAMLAAANSIEEKTPILLEAFIEKIAAVLAVPVDNIMASNPLSSYGLDSIVAVEFRKWFRKVIDVDVALFDVLGAKSIQALVQKAASMISTASAPGAAKEEKNEKEDEVKAESTEAAIIPRADLSKPIPMSTFQSRLWFVHNFLEDKSFLNLPMILHIKGKPNMEIFLQAFQEMVRRNPILTTAHYEGDEFAEQRPNPHFEAEISMRDLSQDPDPKGALEAFIAYNRRIELNIEEGEVFSAALAKLGEDHYVMVNMFHHIAVDRGSSKPWMDRFVVMYDAMRNGKDIASLATPSVSYADFTVWHNELLASAAIQEHVDFWKNSLKGAPDAVKLLPFSKVPERPQRAIPQRAVHKTVLGGKLLNRMKRICSQSNATPFHFLMAAFRAFLFRYTEDKDIVMLMIDGNRPHPDLDELTGFFVNMIPLRLQDDCSEMAFDELLSRSSERALTAMRHNSVPFDAIVDFMEVPKKPEHFPLGQVAINYQVHGDWPPYHTDDFDITRIESDDIPTACELQLEALEETGKGLNLRLEYSTPLYGDEDMERFLDNFLTFLSAAIRDHRQPIAEIPLCGEKEMTLLKEKFWNQEYVPNYWGGVSVLERIHNFAQATPHKTAVKSSNGDSITYAQLAQRAGALAKHLRDDGATAEDVIGVMAVPGVEQIIGIVAGLINGGAYLPMDPDFAVERLAFMASDANTPFILTSGELGNVVSKVAEKCTNSPKFIRIADACAGSEVLAYNKTPDSKDPFYVIYTSGSTGKPKGVVLTHGGTQGMLSNLNHDFGFCNSDKMLHQSSMCFDLSVTQIFAGLTAGGTLCVASRETRKDPTALADFIKDEALTFTYFTPTHFTLLLEQNQEALKANKAYRIAFFAGERFPVRVAKAFYDLGTPATAYNLWAPSETTVQNTKHTILYPKEGDVDVPIGLALANNHLYICDGRMQPLPFGFIGEICVGGVQTGAGYLNRPEKTAETFVLDPFATMEDIAHGWTHVFRTGDRGRYRPDGQLEFHGRLAGDKQIKLRGFRIDLGEVEQRLYSESQKSNVNALADVAVVARSFGAESEESTMDERQLVAYLITKSPVAASQRRDYVTRLHADIAEGLNSYMLPNGYVFLDQMPQLPSAKVDRQNLLQRELDLVFPSSIQSSTVETVEEEIKSGEVENKLEDEVLKLFRDVLGAGRTIELNDNFFERGGNSILMVRLQSKLKRTYKVAPPLPEMVKKPFPSALVEFLRNKLSGGNAKTANSLISWTKEAALPFDGRYIPRYGTPAVDRPSIGSVLLTGAESYIGLHLLAQLLTDNPATHVHVLGSISQISLADIETQFSKYKLFNKTITKTDLSERVTIVAGSLGQDHFGLTKQDFKKLGRSVQAIYHLGGMVSLLQSYSSLREHNVRPILDLIELATYGDVLTELVYLSTWSVLHLQAWKGSKRNNDTIITGEEPSLVFTPPESEEYGYFKTRWVAENLLQQAASRGFPITIARSSAVSSSTTTSVPEPADGFISRMVLDMVDSGLVPEMKGADDIAAPPAAIDFVPVDYLVSSLLKLTTEQKLRPLPGIPDIRHIGNVAPMKLSDLPAAIDLVRPRKGGSKLVPLEEWLSTMESQGNGGDTDGETVKYTVLSEFLRNGHVMFALDQSKTEKALRDVPEDVQCPPIDAAFLKEMWLRSRSA